MFDSNINFHESVFKYLSFNSYKKISSTTYNIHKASKYYFPRFLKLKSPKRKIDIDILHFSQLSKHPILSKLKLLDIGIYNPYDIKLSFNGYIFEDINFINGPFTLIGTFKSISKTNNNVSQYYRIAVTCSFKNGYLDGLYQRVISEYELEDESEEYSSNNLEFLKILNNSIHSYIYYTYYVDGNADNIDLQLSNDYINIIKYKNKNKKNKFYFYKYPQQYTNLKMFFESYPELMVPSWKEKKKFIDNLLSNSYPGFNKIL